MERFRNMFPGTYNIATNYLVASKPTYRFQLRPLMERRSNITSDISSADVAGMMGQNPHFLKVCYRKNYKRKNIQEKGQLEENPHEVG